MWFDLKNAEIFLVDGFTADGAVGGTAPIAGATSLTLTGITGIIANGTRFYIEALTDEIYTVTGHTETTGNTTSVTFTPGIITAPTVADDVHFIGRQLTIKIGEGNLTYNEKQTVEYKRDRGSLDTVRLGDEEPMDVSFEFWWEYLKASTGQPPSIEDVLKNRGEASNWQSSSPDECEPFAIDIIVLHTPNCETQDKEQVELKMFRWETLNHDMKAGQISCSGKCNVKEAVITKIPQAA